MRKKPIITRNCNILFRVSAKEKEALTRMARVKSISVSDLIRSAVHRRPVTDMRYKRKLFNYLDIVSTELNRIGNNINQAVHAMHLANKTGGLYSGDIKRFNELFEAYLAKREELVKRLDRFYNQ